MEAYFLEDKKVLEWVDLIIEKLFTVCLLDNEGSSEDFNEGSKTVSKIATLLQTVSPLTPDTLYEGLKQLIEQRLPEDKVMNHFPSFTEELTNMLRIGLKEVFPNDIPEFQNTAYAIPASSKITLSGGRELYPDTNRRDIISINDYYDPNLPKSDLNAEQEAEPTPNSLLQNDISSPSILDSEISAEMRADFDLGKNEGEILELKTVGAFSRPDYNYDNLTIDNEKSSELKQKHFTFKKKESSANVNASNTKPKSIRMPDHALRLQDVLQQCYPGSKIRWNCYLAKYTFLAQVNDLLVYVKGSSDFEASHIVKEMTNQGWRVLCCSEDDLKFPRRLEREIRALLRTSKKPTR